MRIRTRTVRGVGGPVRAWLAVVALAAVFVGASFAQDNGGKRMELVSLPDYYYDAMRSTLQGAGDRLPDGPVERVSRVERDSGIGSFTGAILAAAVLYTKEHQANPSHADPEMLALATRLGDMLADSSRTGEFDQRSDNHRDLYFWVEAYRLLKEELDAQRRDAWGAELKKRVWALRDKLAARADFPAYTGFLGTSTNHFALWASTVYLGGLTLEEQEWADLGARALHRLAAEEQSPDGHWGEHGYRFPTPGYNYLTFSAVALYWEHSQDLAAMEALRRGTEFHTHYTYPDGTPVETIDGRNRYWRVSPWGSFGFSHFPVGRRYAEFLTTMMTGGGARPARGGTLGRFAQNALYYHDGPTEPIPQELPEYSHRMGVPAGIRKTGPWTVALSGLISPPLPSGQFQLDRQGNMSIFHDDIGLIVTGANSKRQYELATFWESFGEERNNLPVNSRLRMGDEADRLALLYNMFWSEIHLPRPTERELGLRYHVLPRTWNRSAEGFLNLQLVLRPGETLETGAGESFVLGEERIELTPGAIGGWIRHGDWTLRVPDTATLTWPVYPYNPYRAAPETSLRRAVGSLTVELRVWRIAEDIYTGEPYGEDAYDIHFTLQVGERAE